MNDSFIPTQMDWDLFNSIKDDLDEEQINSIDDDTSNTSNLFSNPSLFKTCKECLSPKILYDDGAYYCGDCGQFYGKDINLEEEYRYYGGNDNKQSNPTRVGMPVNQLLQESSIGTTIGYSSKNEFYKLRQYQQYNAMPYKERSLWKVYKLIEQKAIAKNISLNIVKDAQRMYKLLNDATISRGANRMGLIANCLYFACKEAKVPRSYKEIADIFGIKNTDMTRGLKRFKEIWRQQNVSQKIQTHITNPLDLIDRFCSEINIEDKYRYIIEFVIAKTMLYDIANDITATSIATGAIYLIFSLFHIKISKSKIADCCKISEVTISKCYKKLIQYIDILLPKAVLDKHPHFRNLKTL